MSTPPSQPPRRATTRHALAAGVWLAVCGLCLSASPGCTWRPSDADVADVRPTLTIGLTGATTDVRPLVRMLTTQGLVGTGPDGRPTPGLLASWSASDDGRRWQFALRPHVQRHDGATVTATDVAAMIRAQIEYDPPAGLMDIERIEVVDDTGLVVHLREPSSLLLEALTYTRAMPTGPFAASGGVIESDDSPTLEAHRSGDEAATAIARVVFRRYESPRAAWSALMRDEIDVLHEVSGEARPFLEQAEGIEVHPFVRPFVVTLGLNVRHPILQHRDVRRALNHAVDRDALIAQDFGGRGLPASTQVWPRHWAADASLASYTFDRERARALLDGANLPAVMRPDGQRTRFRVTCLIVDDIPRLERVALRLRRAYAEVGIELVVQPLPRADLERRVGSGQFETFLLTMISGHGPNALYGLWGAHGPTRSVDHGYTAAAEAAERLRRAHTDDEVRAAMQQLQHVLADDPPAVFLVWEEMARAIGRRFEAPPSPGRDVLSTLAQWRPRTAAREMSP